MRLDGWSCWNSAPWKRSNNWWLKVSASLAYVVQFWNIWLEWGTGLTGQVRLKLVLECLSPYFITLMCESWSHLQRLTVWFLLQLFRWVLNKEVKLTRITGGLCNITAENHLIQPHKTGLWRCWGPVGLHWLFESFNFPKSSASL